MKYKVAFQNVGDNGIVDIPSGYIPLETYSRKKTLKILYLIPIGV